MAETIDNEQILRRMFDEAWNGKNEAVIDEIVAPDLLCYGLPDPDAIAHGPDGLKQVVRAFCGAFPDLHITIEDIIASGDRVAARWRSSGTHLGDHLGFPASGKQATLSGATICTLRNGKIHQAWNLMDMGHLFEFLRSDSSRG